MGEITKFKPGNAPAFSFAPQSLDEAINYADMIAKSDLVPPDYKGKPANVLIAVQMGAELGLPPLQAIQNIAVVNGRPAVWGDSLLAIARAHPACEYIVETFDDATMTATCRVKRRGEPEQIRTFSRQDAELAGLWNRNTWKQYPRRMLAMRARGFAIRDVFADALRGIALAEEAQDMPPRDMGQAERVEEPRQQERPAALPEYPQNKFENNLPAWRASIEAGKNTADDVIAKVSSRFTLTDEQIQEIKTDVKTGEVM